LTFANGAAKAHILFIDDDAGGREMAAFNLRQAGHTVDEAENGVDGLARFDPVTHELVITDIRMPELSGIEVTRQIHERTAELPVLVITAFGDIETAVQAMQAGAHDFVLKPFNRDQLLIAVDKALDVLRLSRENRDLQRKVRGIERPIISRSATMAAIVELADRVASSTSTAFITGESGTGKELIARRIHARSPRSDGPFIPVNCAAIPADLIEAELFGHVAGAFTGASRSRTGRFRQADGGSLFLDEVGELTLEAQAKLLRVLQENVVDVLGSDQPVSVDVRLIVATNKDLAVEAHAGRFREELFYRLNVVEIALPPLRERPEDIPDLVNYHVAKRADGKEITIADDLLASLGKRSWPGNVRELINACERMLILCTGNTLTSDLLPPEQSAPTSQTSEQPLDPWVSLPPEGFSLLDMEQRLIERVLALKDGNISEAARYLRVPRHILVYRIEKYGITRPTQQ